MGNSKHGAGGEREGREAGSGSLIIASPGAGPGVTVTPDGRRAFSRSDDRTLRVWDLESGACVGLLVVAAPVYAAANSLGRVLAGTSTGEVLFLDTRNMPSGPGIVTVTKFSSGPGGRLDGPVTRCPLCGVQFEPASGIVSAIESLSSHLGPEHSPCLDLPGSAFADPRLLSACPHCARPLQFNPFFVEVRA